MIFFILLLLFIFIILLPIPLKISAHYSHNNYYLKLYGINLYSNNDGIIRKLLNRKSASSKKNNRSNKTNNKTEKKESNKKSFSIKKVYYILKANKFKPSIKFSLLGIYSLSDAALTAILYGLFSSLNFVLLKIFSDFFKVKKFKYSLDPNFKDKFNINFTLNCIITFNFAQIIYILFLIRKKEVSL